MAYIHIDILGALTVSLHPSDRQANKNVHVKMINMFGIRFTMYFSTEFAEDNKCLTNSRHFRHFGCLIVLSFHNYLVRNFTLDYNNLDKQWII